MVVFKVSPSFQRAYSGNRDIPSFSEAPLVNLAENMHFISIGRFSPNGNLFEQKFG